MPSSSKYNPLIHHRRSIRLQGYDYSQTGLYFITICIHNRQCLFGRIENNEMQLSEFGCIAHKQWSTLNERFPHIQLDEFQIMPNHMHGIVHIVGATLAVARNNQDAVARNNQDAVARNNQDAVARNNQDAVADDGRGNDKGAGASPAPTAAKTIGDIVGAYKSLVANECLTIHKQKFVGSDFIPAMEKIWQRNYYEHIIRNETSYHRIRKYIIDNPARWQDDKFNPANHKK
jgi:REP element-mobilizing transposase RayT